MKNNIDNLIFTLKVFVRRSVYFSLFILDRYVFRKNTLLFILCYHSVGDDNWRFSISYKILQKQIAYLIQYYSPMTLEDVELYVKGKKAITKPSFAVTFDDGYKDILQTKEFFKKYGIKPALFLLSNTKKANRKELANNREFLTQKEILDLRKNGWTIGSHSATHADFYELTKERIIDEVVLSKKTLEDMLHIPIKYFAYPRGRYTNKILSAIKRADFSLGLTMDDDYITDKTNPFLIPRIGIDKTHIIHEFKTLYSPSVIKVRGLIKKNLGIII